MTITASMLYDLVQCPHRVLMDLFGDVEQRDPVSAFVELLWEKGNAFEQEIIASLDQPLIDLKSLPPDEKESETARAMDGGEALIYGGRVVADDLVGEPDIIRAGNGGYVAGDVKSGAGEEDVAGAGDKKPKKHYAVQLALYTDILERLGRSTSRHPFVWDINRDEVVYELEVPQGPRTPASLWDFYQEQLTTARMIASGGQTTLPAYSGKCKLCHWRTVCSKALTEAKDLTLIPELGRSKRDGLLPHVKTVADLADADLSTIPKIKGIGPKTLHKIQARARLQSDPKAEPYLSEAVTFPDIETELFFDVETDPMRDVCYLHGFVERSGGTDGNEKYVHFWADQTTSDEERQAFFDAFAYISASQPCAIYYYSPYERTTWRKLQEKYPDVATPEEIEEVFGSDFAVDLYLDVVAKRSEWPTLNYSIKTLATYLGFKWRDTDPSGAASIEWYHRYTETGAAAIKQRILEYNEDDCIAMRVLLEGLKTLPVKS